MVDRADNTQLGTAAPAARRLQTPGVPSSKTLPPTFAALRYYNYRLFFIGQLISLIGTWMQNVAQSWLVYALTGSPFYLGVVSFAACIPMLSFSLGAGVLIDRVEKRTLLVVTQSASMLLAFVLAADVFWGWVQPWHIVILSFLLGLVNTFDAPARQAFAVEMVEDRGDLPNAIALNSAIFQMARIIGPTIAGITLAAIGAAWCFFLNGISFVAVIIALSLMRLKPAARTRSGASALEQLREGLDYIRRTETVRTLITIVAVSNLFAFGYSALMPAFAEDILQSGPTGLGLLSAAVGAGALVAALMVATLANFKHRGVLLTFGNLFFPVMVLLFATSRVLPISMLALAGVGFGFVVQNATINTLIQNTVPDVLRGRVMSLYMLVMNGFFPLGALLAGFIAQSLSIPLGAGFGGAVALVYGLTLLWRKPFVRRMP
jgi:MFS family permease